MASAQLATFMQKKSVFFFFLFSLFKLVALKIVVFAMFLVSFTHSRWIVRNIGNSVLKCNIKWLETKRSQRMNRGYKWRCFRYIVWTWWQWWLQTNKKKTIEYFLRLQNRSMNKFFHESSFFFPATSSHALLLFAVLWCWFFCCCCCCSFLSSVSIALCRSSLRFTSLELVTSCSFSHLVSYSVHLR